MVAETRKQKVCSRTHPPDTIRRKRFQNGPSGFGRGDWPSGLKSDPALHPGREKTGGPPPALLLLRFSIDAAGFSSRCLDVE
jgi:hypothetical protein